MALRPRSSRSDRSARVVSFPTAEEIGERAHELFVRGGGQLVKIPEYWRAAEDELLERAARGVLGPCPRRNL